MTIQPLYDRLLIKPTKAPEAKTTGGLFVPTTADDQIIIGEVIASGGADQNGRALKVNVGDRVMVMKPQAFTGRVRIDGEELFIMWERDILAVVS